MKKLIFLSLLILFYTKTQNIYANPNTFAVDNIMVSGELDEDRKNSREKYLNIAFRKAFKNLVINLLRKEDQKKVLSTDLKMIKSLIENYRIIEEKNLEKDYTLELFVTFDKNKTKDFFYKRNIPYSESSNLEIILYPIMISQSELQLFSQNKFFQEWNDNKDFDHINFVLPIENIEDINFIKKNKEILEEIDLSKLINNYEIKNSTILIFRFNKKKLDVFLKTNLNGIKKINKTEFTVENLDNKEVRADLISSLKFFINELWKEEHLVDISAPASLTFTTKLNNPGALQIITSRIDNINFIENYAIEELSKDSVKIKIRYLGKIKNIQESFIKNGFKFQIIQDEWILSLSS